MRIKFARLTRMMCLLIPLLLVLSMGGCRTSTPPPPLEDIYDAAVALIEASFAVNDVMFGAGLPVWHVGSEFAEQYGLYNDDDYATYEYVTNDSPYLSIGEIKDAIAQVYSKEYAQSLYGVLFDGYVVGTRVVRAQIYEGANGLMQSIDYEPIITQQRVYDYTTMQIVSPSNATYVTISLDSYEEGKTEPTLAHLKLILEQDGWRLDTPTY